MKRQFQILTAAICVLVLSGSLSAQNVLKIGDNAPAIKYSKWFKGTAVEKFDSKMVYVVEFWATWCGPCKVSIPHLTELQHKYKGKVKFIGMDGSERPKPGEDANKLVEDFLKEMGDKMDYDVAMDTKDNFMINNWFRAAGQSGIPCAFVVNKEGKVAWIGHPMNMDKPLEEIVAGTFDLAAFAVKFGAEQEKAIKANEERAKFAALIKPVTEAQKAKDDAKVIAECETLMAKDASITPKLYNYYVPALLKVSADKAYEFAVAENKKDAKNGQAIAQIFTDKGYDKRFYLFVVDVYKPVIEKDPKGYMPNVILGEVYEYLGENQKAIACMENVIEFGKANKAPDNLIKEWEATIKRLKEGK